MGLAYLSQHVNIGRTDFDFSAAEDADVELDLGEKADLIPRSDIRAKALEFIERDLEKIIETINAAKLERTGFHGSDPAIKRRDQNNVRCSS
jgi:hypothetical protein